MTFVVTDNCIRCKYTDCVDVCPVDCFHEGEHMLVIDPEVCIDCALCVPECPIDAIASDKELPEKYVHFIELNARLAREWPVLDHTKEHSGDADEWADRENKLASIAV